MRKFKDSSKKEWELSLTAGDMTRVKTASEGRFNLFDPDSKPGGSCGDRTIAEVLNCEQTADYETLWEVLYLLIEPQASERQVTAEAFGKSMTPDCLIVAQAALQKEWADFFRQLQRPDKALPLEKLAEWTLLALQKAKKAEPLIAEMDAQIDAAMDARLKDSFGSLQEKLAAILTPSRSASSPECATASSDASAS